ncbi:MAG: ABC transporter substrate-binding protein [Candidatus Binatia bacterium]
MLNHRLAVRLLTISCVLGALVVFRLPDAWSQSPAKKVRLALPSTNVTFIPMFAALRKGYFKDEGLDVEIIMMRANMASTALLTGDIDYNGAVTGVIGGAIKGQPLKAIIFTATSPMMSMIGGKGITKPEHVKGKKLATSSPGGTATLVAKHILQKFGLDPERDAVLAYVGRDPARFAALESGVVDIAMLSPPTNIIARRKGFSELAFAADYIRFPQNGFGATEKKIQEQSDEVLGMIKATLKGLAFVTAKQNKQAVIDMIMTEWKISDRDLASEMYRYMTSVMSPGAALDMDGLQILVDQQRENAKVSTPVKASKVIDYSFVEKARRDIGSSN